MSTEHEGRIKVGITIGDIHGIGPEIVIKALSDNRITQVCTPIIYGNSKVISHYRKTLSQQEFNYITIRSIHDIIPKKVNLINCWEEELKIEMGVASQINGPYAMKALEAATNDLKGGFIDALVTAPIDKHSIAPQGGFSGHTEYLAQAFNTSDYLMFLVSGNLRVALVTGHVPISKIAPMITGERIKQKLNVMIKSLKRDFGIRKPKIAVLGLNPHAGDSGVIGNEDRDIIAPTIKEAFAAGLLVFGPYSSDGFFGTGQHDKFDAVLAMYHDQGLIPFKTLAFENGVNFTAGLPIVRTSPDHGVAYDIAGKGIASESSLREALYSAVDIVNRRVDYDEVNEKPLAFGKLTGER